MPLPKSILHTTATTLSLAALYFFAGKLGLMFAFFHVSATAVWPPTGIALAALLLFGYRVWPGIFLGAFLVNMTTAGSVLTSLGIAFGNTLEGLAGAYLANTFAQGRHAFDRVPDIFKFTVLAGLGSTALSATCGVTSLALGGYADWSDYGFIWLTWWLGDAGGALLVTPLLLLWSPPPHFNWNRNQIIEAMLLLLALAVVGQLVFGGWLPTTAKEYPLAYLCVPILVWSAFRFGPREAATVSVLLAGLAIRGTLHGFGPFVGLTWNESLTLLQTFMIFTAVMILTLATIVGERRRAIAVQAQLAAIVESSHDGIIGKTLAGNIASWNAAAERIFGYTAAEAIGQPVTLLHPPDRLDEESAILDRLKRGERIDHFETLRRRKDGGLIDVSLTISPIKSPEGTVIGVSKIVRDISERKRTEKVLAKTNQMLLDRVRELEQQSRQITLLSEMGGLLQSSHTLEEAYAIISTYAPQLFRDEGGLLAVVGSASPIVETVVTWHEPLSSRTEFRLDECWALRRAQIYVRGQSGAGPFCQHLGRPLPFSYLCVPIIAESETLGVLYVQGGRRTERLAGPPDQALDSSMQRMAQAMAQHIALAIANLKLRAVLRSQATRDPLTGLFNRRYLTELLDLELRRAHRNRHPVGMIMLDLDHFKRVNDTFGHLAGDMVLREFAGLLKAKCRSGDIVSRLGGEEFVLILPAASLEDTTRRADALRVAVEHLPLSFDNRNLDPVTISLGVAVFPDHGMTCEALIQAADSALYQAKQGGRNRVVTAGFS